MGLSGCLVAMSSYQPEAFSKNKTFALVTVATTPEIGVSGACHGGGGFTLSGMFKAASSDSGYSHSSDKVFAESVPVLIQEPGKSRNFRLAPTRWVTQHKAYRAMEEDSPKKFMVTYRVPKGYKYFDSESKLASLAKELNVDAVVILHVSYNAAFSGVGAAGTHKGTVLLAVAAIDRQAKVVWKDAVQTSSDDSVGSLGESANFVKLQPLFQDATRAASRKLLENLNQKVASL